jgi:hypothetical protein
MGFDTGLKVAALCAVTLASNLVLAAEGRVASKVDKAQSQQLKHLPAKPAVVTESAVDMPRVVEPRVASEPILKQEGIPVETMVPPLELKGVRG